MLTIKSAALAKTVLNCSTSTLYEKLKPTSKYYDATFPRPIKTGARSVAFLQSEIEVWLKSQPRT
ncbi:MAG: AlpA family phage regulatory protein [Methyloglobulus sp.]|nr:AlpA family phage regulatory protein [Methyloglobulus sp.]